jgi:hypothetical protein
MAHMSPDVAARFATEADASGLGSGAIRGWISVEEFEREVGELLQGHETDEPFERDMQRQLLIDE